jgi:hypothetical protein
MGKDGMDGRGLYAATEEALIASIQKDKDVKSLKNFGKSVKLSVPLRICRQHIYMGMIGNCGKCNAAHDCKIVCCNDPAGTGSRGQIHEFDARLL